ncbi:MAG: N-acetyltransferase [Ignavibacteria bacterium]|nr:N-acetyltransferase [Ignavibacteria bacterium]
MNLNSTYSIRLISESDTESVLAVYAPFILNSDVTFEYEVPTVVEFAERISSHTVEFPWLVCLSGDCIVGYAYAGKHRTRAAYQWSPELTVYLSEDVQGKGIARILYETLFAILKLQGYYTVFAGVTMPNTNSEGLHKAMGFEEIGIFKKVGFKHGKWHDTKWFQLHLSEYTSSPHIPRTIHEVVDMQEFASIIYTANRSLSIITT